MQRQKSCLKLTELSPVHTIDPQSVTFRLNQPDKLILTPLCSIENLGKELSGSLRGSQSDRKKVRQRKGVVFEKPKELVLSPAELPSLPQNDEPRTTTEDEPDEPQKFTVSFPTRAGTTRAKLPRKFAKQSVYINTYLRGGQILSDDRVGI